jgi:HEPN domain-containing protein
MPPKESLYPLDWFRVAERDLKRVKKLLGQQDASLAGFCLQQAVEKYLKAFLLSKGWQLRRIHNLDAILDDAVAYDKSLETFRPVCQKISAFYSLERYPLLPETEVSEEDVRSCLAETKDLIEKLRFLNHQ